MNYRKRSLYFYYFYIVIKIQLKGFDKAVAEIEKTAKEVKEDVHFALVDFGTSVERDAKLDAPADEGKLRNSISATFPTKDKGLSVQIAVTADYAAYIEFGTRKFAAKYVATLPPDWKSYAATFKGKGGGNLNQFIQAIMAWVRRKGIGADITKSGNFSSSASSLDKQQQAAYWIALNILQNGIKPQPFLYPAVQKHTPELEKAIKKIYE